jgi:Holliday junction resolvase RusA-like endonuclease
MKIRQIFELKTIPKAQMRARHGKDRAGNPRTYKDPKQATEEQVLSYLLLPFKPKEPILGPVWLHVTCVMPIPKSTSKRRSKLMREGYICHLKKPDCSNLLKNIEDVMTQMRFWGDDSQVVDSRCEKFYEDEKGPRWIVDLEYIDGWTPL